MKNFFIFFILILSLFIFSSCNSSDTDNTYSTDPSSSQETIRYDLDTVAAAFKKEHMSLVYNETTASDFELPSFIEFDGISFPIVWESDCENVDISRNDYQRSVTISIKADENKEIKYMLKANIQTPEKNDSVSVSFDLTIPADVSRFQGKRLATFGSSTTWYDGNAYTWGKEKGKIAVGYQSHMRRELGLEIDNYGTSGHTMIQIMKTLANTDITSYDYITILSGCNDERHGIPIGEIKPKNSSFNTDTYCGAMQTAIEHTLRSNPDVKIMLMTSNPAWIYAPDGYGPNNPQTEDGIVTEKWANAMKEIAELYDLEVCDLYTQSGFNEENRRIYINDPEPEDGNKLYSTHPSTLGYKVLAKVIIKDFIEKY